jgi:hypothetical protein
MSVVAVAVVPLIRSQDSPLLGSLLLPSQQDVADQLRKTPEGPFTS